MTNNITFNGSFMIYGIVKDAIVTRFMYESERRTADEIRHYICEELQPVANESVQLRLSDAEIIPLFSNGLTRAEKYAEARIFPSHFNGCDAPAFTARYKLTPEMYEYDSSIDQYVVMKHPYNPKPNDNVVASCVYLTGPNGDFYRLDKLFLVDSDVHLEALMRERSRNNVKRVPRKKKGGVRA